LGLALFIGGAIGTLYIAIEPYVRRRWPQILVSWTRLLSGEWRDPLVARDALIGCAFGALAYAGFQFARYLIPSWLGIEALISPPFAFTLATVLGTNHFVAGILEVILSAINWNLAIVSVLFVLRVLLRNQKAAIIASIVIISSVDSIGDFYGLAICLVFFYPLWFFVLMRFGLVAGMLFQFLGHVMYRFPIGFETSAWYSGTGYAALAILAVVVLYAFRTSLGGRPLITAPHLDD
jgi:serine/threonine-protein kinase